MLRAMRWLPWVTRAAPPLEAAPRLNLTEVHAAHADFIWASLQRLGVRDADLADLLQEVFVVVHQRLHTFDTSADLPPWLFGICRRVAAAHRRRAYVRRELPAERPAEAVEDASPDPEQAAVMGQARNKLEAILDEIDQEKRAVFVMFEIDELPCEAIAEMLGVPVGTVYSRLHAARKAFQKALARNNAREARGGGS